MILGEFEVRASILACGRDKALSQVRDDPKGGGLANVGNMVEYMLFAVRVVHVL